VSCSSSHVVWPAPLLPASQLRRSRPQAARLCARLLYIAFTGHHHTVVIIRIIIISRARNELLSFVVGVPVVSLTDTVLVVAVTVIGRACIVCGAVSMKLPCVCLSVCLSRLAAARRCSGFAGERPAARICGSTAAQPWCAGSKQQPHCSGG